MKEIIDCHSHIGTDMYWPNVGTIEEYSKNASQNGITESFLMPIPCPIYFDDNKKIVLLKYKHYGEEIRYFSFVEDLKTGEIITKEVLKNINPYKRANDELYNVCKNNPKYNYVPLIHPYFYSIEDFEEHIKRGAKIFKIHGIACGIIPKEIREEFFRMIEYLKIPLLIHTDYSDKENIFQYNDANHWLDVLTKYNIRVYFAHAARFVNCAIAAVNSDDRYIIGLGPDKVINDNATPMADKNDDYLSKCLSIFDLNKVVFDIDYPWNTVSCDNKTLEWDSPVRVKKILSETEQEKVFGKNMKRFIGGKCD